MPLLADGINYYGEYESWKQIDGIWCNIESICVLKWRRDEGESYADFQQRYRNHITHKQERFAVRQAALRISGATIHYTNHNLSTDFRENLHGLNIL